MWRASGQIDRHHDKAKNLRNVVDRVDADTNGVETAVLNRFSIGRVVTTERWNGRNQDESSLHRKPDGLESSARPTTSPTKVETL